MKPFKSQYVIAGVHASLASIGPQLLPGATPEVSEFSAGLLLAAIAGFVLQTIYFVWKQPAHIFGNGRYTVSIAVVSYLLIAAFTAAAFWSDAIGVMHHAAHVGFLIGGALYALGLGPVLDHHDSDNRDRMRATPH